MLSRDARGNCLIPPVTAAYPDARNPVFIHIQDGNADIFDTDTVANPGQPVQVPERHTADGCHARIVNPEIAQVIEISQLHVPVDLVGIFVALAIQLLALDITGNLAEYKCQHIFHGDEALDPAKLVQDSRGAGIIGRKEVEHFVNFFGERYHHRRVHDVSRFQ